VTKAEVFNRYGDEVWVRGDFSNVGELLSEDYVGHSGLEERNLEGLRTAVELFRAQHPNIHLDVLEQFEAGDRLVSRLRVYSAGKTATGINISRFEGDRIAEEWAAWMEFE
jgi:SnoaL-like polyketide cyclase